MTRRHCHICGGVYAVTAKGKLYAHQRVMGSGKGACIPYVSERCPGSGQEPTGFWRPGG